LSLTHPRDLAPKYVRQLPPAPVTGKSHDSSTVTSVANTHQSGHIASTRTRGVQSEIAVERQAARYSKSLSSLNPGQSRLRVSTFKGCIKGPSRCYIDSGCSYSYSKQGGLEGFGVYLLGTTSCSQYYCYFILNAV
jgi:hypothetical protein